MSFYLRSLNRSALLMMGSIALVVWWSPLMSTASPGPVVFEPHGHGVRQYYSRGVPFAFCLVGDFRVIMQLESFRIGGKTFGRLWLACVNQSDEIVDLDPARWLTMTSRTGRTFELHEVPPEPAWAVLKRIEDQKQRDRASVIFSAAMTGLAVGLSGVLTDADTRISGSVNGEHLSIRIHDAEEKTAAKMREIASAEQLGLDAVEREAERFARAVGGGALRRDTLLPGAAVQGFVYLPFVEKERVVERGTGRLAADTVVVERRRFFERCSHTIRLVTPHKDTVVVDFRPSTGY